MLLLMPAIWTLAEWLRGLLFTGFPWLSVGYSQVPNSPLAGYAPLLGVYGVSLMVAVSAGLLLVLWNVRWSRQGKIALAVLLAMWVSGAVLRNVEWTQPQGEPLKVSLLQGNIPQDTKFEQDALIGTLETYRRLAQSSDARLIVMPETAVPLLRENVPQSYQIILREHVRQNGGDILIGAFEKENGNYYNSVYYAGQFGEPALPQRPPRAVRRIHSPAQRVRLADQRSAADPDGRPDQRRRAPSAAQRRRTKGCSEHLLRRRLRRRDHPRAAASHVAGERHQRCVVRRFARRACSTTSCRRCARWKRGA